MRGIRIGIVGAALLVTSACSVSEPPALEGQSRPTVIPVAPVTQVPADEVPARLRPAVSLPREDSRHPDAGDPGVDALSYDLDLSWVPEARTLTGVATPASASSAWAPAMSTSAKASEPLLATTSS